MFIILRLRTWLVGNLFVYFKFLEYNYDQQNYKVFSFQSSGSYFHFNFHNHDYTKTRIELENQSVVQVNLGQLMSIALTVQNEVLNSRLLEPYIMIIHDSGFLFFKGDQMLSPYRFTSLNVLCGKRLYKIFMLGNMPN